MRYDTVIFDLDGTLLDTLDDLRGSVNAAMRFAGCPERTADEVRRALGHGARHLIEQCMPAGADRDVTRHVLDFYIPYYEAHSDVKTAPYPGVLDLLRRLRAAGARTAVVSNKPHGAVRRLTERYFPGLLDASVGMTADMAVKPSPDALLAVMDRLGARRENTVYVGDSDVDIDTARNAGVFCVSITWGFRDEAELRAHGAAALAHDADALAALLGV